MALIIPKVKFHGFQFLITVRKDTETQGIKFHKTVHNDFEFMNNLLTQSNFYYRDPYRAIYMALKCFMKIGEPITFKDIGTPGIDFILVVYPLKNSKLPYNKNDFFELTEILEDITHQFLEFFTLDNIKKKGDCISTLGGNN